MKDLTTQNQPAQIGKRLLTLMKDLDSWSRSIWLASKVSEVLGRAFIKMGEALTLSLYVWFIGIESWPRQSLYEADRARLSGALSRTE